MGQWGYGLAKSHLVLWWFFALVLPVNLLNFQMNTATIKIVVKESGKRMARRKNELLTEVELEFMKVLWKVGTGTVREIYVELAKETSRAYTSVATTLKVLEGKGYVSSEKDDRTLSYRPALSKDSYEQKSLREMSRSLFGGTPSALVARLVDDEELSDEMIAEIQEIIDQRTGRNAS